MQRRALLASALAITCRPALATPETMAGSIRRFTGGVPTQPGRVRIDIAPLVENGNAVPVTLGVDGPLNAGQQVSAIALFTSRNPEPDVAVFRLGPRAGSASVATRMRLATSQTVVAIAQLGDGSFWQADVAVEVTQAACVEGGG